MSIKESNALITPVVRGTFQLGLAVGISGSNLIPLLFDQSYVGVATGPDDVIVAPPSVIRASVAPFLGSDLPAGTPLALPLPGGSVAGPAFLRSPGQFVPANTSAGLFGPAVIRAVSLEAVPAAGGLVRVLLTEPEAVDLGSFLDRGYITPNALLAPVAHSHNDNLLHTLVGSPPPGMIRVVNQVTLQAEAATDVNWFIDGAASYALTPQLGVTDTETYLYGLGVVLFQGESLAVQRTSGAAVFRPSATFFELPEAGWFPIRQEILTAAQFTMIPAPTTGTSIIPSFLPATFTPGLFIYNSDSAPVNYFITAAGNVIQKQAALASGAAAQLACIKPIAYPSFPVAIQLSAPVATGPVVVVGAYLNYP